MRSATSQERDQILTILSVGNTGEGHGITRSEVSRGLDPLVEVAVGPLEGGLSGESG